jgi:hypothetical protein
MDLHILFALISRYSARSLAERCAVRASTSSSIEISNNDACERTRLIPHLIHKLNPRMIVASVKGFSRS